MFIRVVVKYEDREFKIKVTRDTTVGMLMIKIRKFLKLKPEEGVFLFWPRRFRSDALHPGSKLLSDIQTEPLQMLQCNLLCENTFGAWGRGFCSAKIEKKKDLFVVSITWSWYAITTWTEVEVFETLEEAKSYVLKERCAGGLTLSL